jgi:hypothetical protein
VVKPFLLVNYQFHSQSIFLHRIHRNSKIKARTIPLISRKVENTVAKLPFSRTEFLTIAFVFAYVEKYHR